MDKKALLEILEVIRKQRDFWCADCVDDPEEMMQELPELFRTIVPKMEKALDIGESNEVQETPPADPTLVKQLLKDQSIMEIIEKNSKRIADAIIELRFIQHQQYYVICPVCNGKKFVPNGFYDIPGIYIQATSLLENCRTCNGFGAILIGGKSE